MGRMALQKCVEPKVDFKNGHCESYCSLYLEDQSIQEANEECQLVD